MVSDALIGFDRISPALGGFEIGLGSWLLFFGFHPPWLATAAPWFFGFLAGVTGYKIIIGESDCGCFGQVTVSPWLTFFIDLTLACSISCRLRETTRDRQLRIGLAVAAASFVAVAVILPTMAVSDGNPAGLVVGPTAAVITAPERWVGARLPLLPHIDLGAKLASGAWTVVVVRPGCGECEEVARDWEGWAERATDRRVAFVALVNSDRFNNESFRRHGCIHGHFNDGRRWEAATPFALDLRDGEVLRFRADGRPGDG